MPTFAKNAKYGIIYLSLNSLSSFDPGGKLDSAVTKLALIIPDSNRNIPSAPRSVMVYARIKETLV